MVYDWEVHRSEILNRLEQPAWLKICTKNFDEPELIENWILHHAAIVGFKNLIIADNLSADPETINVYEKYSDLVTIFKFSGNFDEIHSHPRFSALFEVIRNSAKFYAVFDTDEQLVLIEEDQWKSGSTILQRLSVADMQKPIPTTWLINKMNSLNSFGFKTTEGSEEFVNNMIWGKPILPGKLVGIQPGIHNVQFQNFSFSASKSLSLFLLHLTQLPDRRLRINKSKLVNSGVVSQSWSFEEIAALDASKISNSNAIRFISEIRLMLAAKRSFTVLETGSGWSLELAPGGGVLYSSGAAREFMKEFLYNWKLTVEATFDSLS